MTHHTPLSPLAADLVPSWDITTDVVVVGAGAAGLSAAISAAEAGADVTVLERFGGVGGASALSGGLIYLGGGTDLQRACGVEDTADEMFRFLMAATGPGSDPAKTRLYCDESPRHYEWLVSCGVEFKASIYDGAFPEPPTDDGLMYTGGEDAEPWASIAKPAQRGHVPRLDDKRPGERSGGWALIDALSRRAEVAGVATRCDTPVQRLIVDDKDRIVGVVASSFGDTLHVRACGGVILTSGGFVFNDSMLAQHSPRLIGCNKLGTDGDDGISIRLAQAVGAGVKHMANAEVAYAAFTGLIAPSIVVNGHGQRFVNEDTYFGRVGQKILFENDGVSFVVFDEETWESIEPIHKRGLQPTWVSSTAAELEREMELPVGSLVATLAYYNEHASTGRDPQFGKQERWLRAFKPPYGAIDMRQGRLTVFTLGGLDTTVDGEVRDVSGDPIDGLFAAGRTTSGIPTAGYLSGTSLGDATFFGRRSGASAAARTERAKSDR